MTACAVLAGMILFGTAPPPQPMASVNRPAAEAIDRLPMAPLERYTARDGTSLAYRACLPTGTAQVAAILVHGSGGSSANMNVLCHALADAGVAAYAIDIRGHGFSGRRGDIDYVGQQEDDLADLAATLRPRHPGARFVLAGHSSGGGFALRVAGEPTGRLFQRFVLLAPYLGQGAPTTRPDDAGWAVPYVPRIVALSILNRFGITAFNGLPVLALALPPAPPEAGLTPIWSYRLLMNFGPGPSYRDDAAHAAGPIEVLAGLSDDNFYADRYREAFAGIVPPVRVAVLDGVGHMGIISDDRALSAVVAAIAGRVPGEAK